MNRLHTAGIGLIVVLVMLRERIEDAVILLLAALFTISPVLLTIGRTAGGAGKEIRAGDQLRHLPARGY